MELWKLALVGAVMFGGGGFIAFAHMMGGDDRTPISAWIALIGFVLIIGAALAAVWRFLA